MHHCSAKLTEYNITRSDYRPRNTKFVSACPCVDRMYGSTSGESVEKNHCDYQAFPVG